MEKFGNVCAKLAVNKENDAMVHQPHISVVIITAWSYGKRMIILSFNASFTIGSFNNLYWVDLLNHTLESLTSYASAWLCLYVQYESSMPPPQQSLSGVIIMPKLAEELIKASQMSMASFWLNKEVLCHAYMQRVKHAQSIINTQQSAGCREWILSGH